MKHIMIRHPCAWLWRHRSSDTDVSFNKLNKKQLLRLTNSFPLVSFPTARFVSQSEVWKFGQTRTRIGGRSCQLDPTGQADLLSRSFLFQKANLRFLLSANLLQTLPVFCSFSPVLSISFGSFAQGSESCHRHCLGKCRGTGRTWKAAGKPSSFLFLFCLAFVPRRTEKRTKKREEMGKRKSQMRHWHFCKSLAGCRIS